MIRRTTTNNKLILNIDMRGLLRCDIVHTTAPPSPKWSHKCTRRSNTQMTFNSKWEMTLKISGKSSFYENKDSQENRSKILMNISPHILTFCGFNRSSAAHKLWYSIFFQSAASGFMQIAHTKCSTIFISFIISYVTIKARYMNIEFIHSTNRLFSDTSSTTTQMIAGTFITKRDNWAMLNVSTTSYNSIKANTTHSGLWSIPQVNESVVEQTKTNHRFIFHFIVWYDLLV